MSDIRARIGSPYSNRDAKTIQQFISRQFPNGATPLQIVEAARPTASPIHKYFEWNAKKAHTIYLQEKAREMMSAVEVYMQGQWVRQYVNVKVSEHDRRYISTEKALERKDLWKQVEDDLLREAQAWKARSLTYSRLKPIHKAIDHVSAAPRA